GARSGPSVTCRLGSFALRLAFASIASSAPLPSRVRAPNGRSPDVLGSTSQRRVWPNRGAAGPDSYPDVNVLAVLHARNRINDWLTKNVTPWPYDRLAFAKDRRGYPRFTARESADRSQARRAPWRSRPRRRRRRCCRRRPRHARSRAARRV